jgi:hypothetical protein
MWTRSLSRNDVSFIRTSIERERPGIINERILVDARDRFGIFLPDLLAGKDDMNRVASLGIRSIQEHVDTRRVAMEEPGRFERRNRPRQVGPVEDDVDFPRVADDGLPDLGDPVLRGAIAHDGIRNARGIKGCRPAQAILDVFRGPLDSGPQGLASVFDFGDRSPPMPVYLLSMQAFAHASGSRPGASSVTPLPGMSG